MDRAQLLRHFDTLAETPDAVAKLRELVLDFAIRGRLVPQDLKDEPAIQLVERAKASLTKKRGKSTEQQNGEHEVLPFSLHKNWCWTCLEELGETSPRNEIDDKTEVGFSPMRLVSAKFGVPVQFEPKTWGEVRKGFTHFAEGDVVVAKITPCFENAKSGVIRGAPNGFGAGTTELHVLRPIANCVMPEYVLIFLKSPHFLINGEKHMTGSAGQKRVPSSYFAKTPFPLPPLAEQRRIVAKVEELLSLCDELEARQAAAREHRTRLVRSALDHLTTAQSEPEFQHRTAFVLQNSDLTFDSVSDLRRAILSLAVQGHLVPQNSRDGSGADAVNKILKQRGIQSSTHETASEDLPNLPDTWDAVAMADIFEVVGGIQKTPQRTPRDNAFPYLRVANVQRGRLNLDDVQKFELLNGEIQRWKLEPKDVLVVEGNGSEDEIGRCAQWQGEIQNCVHQNHIIRCRPFGHDAKFSILFLNSPVGIAEMKRRAITTSGLYSLSVGKIRSLTVPFPPLAEQQRIVAKVDELMRWCDALEARLTAAQTTASTLLDATLHQILNRADN